MKIKTVSIPHWDNIEDSSLFFNYLQNKQNIGNINELRDIYFGGVFYSSNNVRYSNVMGCIPSEEQYKNLLKIQEKFNVEISLTLNDSNKPYELVIDKQTRDEFVKYIEKFYEDGVRSCTISHTHLMREGILQEKFPEMRWKNTVNHQIKSTQEAIDYKALGYNTLLLDRSLNRDIKELNNVYKQQKSGYLRNIETSLLISEACMPSCTFKHEHDSWNSRVTFNKLGGYSNLYKGTCYFWKQLEIPRFTTNIELYNVKDYEEYNVDVFKISGRKTPRLEVPFEGLVLQVNNKNLIIDSIHTLLDNNIPYISEWLTKGFNNYLVPEYSTISEIEDIKTILNEEYYLPPNYPKLVKVLQNCKNQCYDCHACERVFNYEDLETVLHVK